MICTQTSHLSPLPVLVGAENGNQVNALLFNGSLRERGGSETEEQDAEGNRGVGAGWRGERRGEQGGMREKEAMKPENEKGVGKRGPGKGGQLSPSLGTGEREIRGGGRHTDTHTHR